MALDKQPIAESLAELQAQVDRFDVIYNTQRQHQGLPRRITPQHAWDATRIAEPPCPDVEKLTQGGEAETSGASYQVPQPSGPLLTTEPETLLVAVPTRLVAGSFNIIEPAVDRMLKVYSNGTIRFKDVVYF